MIVKWRHISGSCKLKDRYQGHLKPILIHICSAALVYKQYGPVCRMGFSACKIIDNKERLGIYLKCICLDRFKLPGSKTFKTQGSMRSAYWVKLYI